MFKIKKSKFDEIRSKLSIWYQDESSFEISQKIWRVLCKSWEKPIRKGKEKRHDTLSITWAYSMEWELLYRSSKTKKQGDFLKFLYQLRHREKKKWIVLIVDNARIHWSKKVRAYCESHYIKLIYLPPYSPELNPIEFLWKRIKKVYRMIQRNHNEIMRWVQVATKKLRWEFMWYDLAENILYI